MATNDNNISLTWWQNLLICCAILLGAGLIVTGIFLVEPTSKPTGATKKTAMLVNTVTVERGEYNPTIEALGRVEPALDITLSPRVSGEIIKRADQFIPGGFVSKGDLLLQIDRSDYKNKLQQKRSELRRANSQLSIELGRQDVAQKEYNLFGENLSQKNRKLILRKPQLNSARAEVESAQAAVNQAELDLERTRIKAPFDAQVLERKVNVGSQVAPGNELGRLVGTKEYWIVATVPLSKRNWIETTKQKTKKSPPDQNQKDKKAKRKSASKNNETDKSVKEVKGSTVTIRNRAAWDPGVQRKGYVEKVVGSLDEETRMARLLVSVPDPLALEKDTIGPPLIIGSLLHVTIEGRTIADVVRLNRDYVREQDKVWVMRNGELEIRTMDIVFRDADYVYARKGLRDGDKVVTTNLSTVTEGAALRTPPKGKTNE